MLEDSRRNGIGREVLGIVLLGIAFFLGIALYSYHPSDPSLNVQHIGKESGIQNLGGIVGAYGADLFVQIFGVAVYLICFGAWIENINLQGQKIVPGGGFGELISAVFSKYLSAFGASFLIVFLLILFTVMATGISFSQLFLGLYDLIVMALRRLEVLVTIRFEQIGRQRRVGAEKNMRHQKSGERVTRVMEPPRTRGAKEVPLLQEEFGFLEAKGTFHLPPVSLLDTPGEDGIKVDKQSLVINSEILEKKLRDYGVEGKVVEVRPGPVITVFEFEPAPGVKVSKIVGLADDLALALSAVSIRIVAPIPGKAVVGIEIPNKVRRMVHLQQIVRSEEFQESRTKLSICLGVGISGEPFVIDLVRMPHLLVAGSTGSGKSVFLNAMICSILFKRRPEEVRFLMIDPKMLELSLYEGVPHLLLPVVTNPKKAALGLNWLVEEMERRYEILAERGVRNIDQYNRQVERSLKDGTSQVYRKRGDILEEEKGEGMEEPERLPYIVVVVDELADLMMVSSRDVEEAITRLAQMARAVGIHLILATQRPSVDVITGIIKANFPARISFQVSSKVDSRTILDTVGAEHLLGAGDMLFLPPGSSKMVRVHGAFISEIEIRRVVDFLKKQGKPEYDVSIIEEKRTRDAHADEEEYDEKYDEAVAFVAETGQASISLIQRRFRIGYNRAARIVERMEAEGIVGPSDGVKPREVLIHKIN
jgi:S-DNA-T family DNA segregation ATPase FtsK/SpoIIIE